MARWLGENRAIVEPLAITLGVLAGVIMLIVGVTKVWTAVQTALNVVMMLNPSVCSSWPSLRSSLASPCSGRTAKVPQLLDHGLERDRGRAALGRRGDRLVLDEHDQPGRGRGPALVVRLLLRLQGHRQRRDRRVHLDHHQGDSVHRLDPRHERQDRRGGPGHVQRHPRGLPIRCELDRRSLERAQLPHPWGQRARHRPGVGGATLSTPTCRTWPVVAPPARPAWRTSPNGARRPSTCRRARA
ncbi:hypothetical protein NKG94_34460 [Micromonospora sp. M12]